MDIVCCQIDTIWEDPERNLALISEQLANAAPAAGSLIVLPEMCTTGFTMNSSEAAEDLSNSPSLAALGQLASQHQSHLLAGIALSDNGVMTNDAALFNPTGTLTGRYSKIQSFTTSNEDKSYTPGRIVSTMPVGDWTIAPLICYDLRFPELFRLAAPEAELFVVIANWPTKRVEQKLALLKARAIENQAYVVGVNRAGSDPNMDFPGQSIVIDPQGNHLAQAGSGAEVLTIPIDLKTVHDWRNQFPALHDRISSSELSVQNLS